MKPRILLAVFGILIGSCSSPSVTSPTVEGSQQASSPTTTSTSDRTFAPAEETVVAVPHQTADAGVASLVLEYVLPAGYEVNEDAPSSISVVGGDPLITLEHPEGGNLTGTHIPAVVPIVLHEGTGTVVLDVTLIYCRSEETSLCLSDDVRYKIPLTVGPEGVSSQIFVDRSAPLPAG